LYGFTVTAWAFKCSNCSLISFLSQALRSGSLCGGYRDKSKSVILAYRNYTSLQKLLKEAEEEVQKNKDEMKELRDEMTKYSSDKQKVERKIINAK
jgi:chromosome segregation ATPase